MTIVDPDNADSDRSGRACGAGSGVLASAIDGVSDVRRSLAGAIASRGRTDAARRIHAAVFGAARQAVTVMTLIAILFLAMSHGEAEHHPWSASPSASQSVEARLSAPTLPDMSEKTGLASLECSVSCAVPLPIVGLALRAVIADQTVVSPIYRTGRGVDLVLSTPPPRIG